jgi:anhydro-N-acetylmuramic acid kinase
MDQNGLYCGIMTGTSLDGIDVSFAEISVVSADPHRPAMTVRPIAHSSIAFEGDLRERIRRLRSASDLRIADVCDLNFRLGHAYAESVEYAASIHELSLARVRAIGLHGQTVWHSPPSSRPEVAATLQLGEPAVLVERLRTTVVSNFRSRDIAAGGEGAPLVPFADYILFSHPTESRVILNLGGIANITSLPAGAGLSQVIAFDTGPANMILDRIAQRCFGEDFDEDGEHAAAGKVDKALLEAWLEHPYFSMTPPKSTGYEAFGDSFLNAALEDKKAQADLMRTAVALTAESVGRALRQFLPSLPDKVIAGGGGTRNPVLMEALRKAVAPAILQTHEEYGISSQEKEAVAFAILAAANLSGIPAGVPSSTGASGPRLLGSVTRPE